MKIGIIGCGMVGGALRMACLQKGFKVLVLDPFKKDLNDGMRILESDIAFVCVPTPTEDRVQNLQALHNVLGLLSAEDYKGLVVLKSTILPGTTDIMHEKYKNLRFAHNPEFLKERTAFKDTLKQKVCLISAYSKPDLMELYNFWKEFDPRLETRVSMNPKETELAKYFHNCFLATKVTVANEFAEICNRLKIDYTTVMRMTQKAGGLGEGHLDVPGHHGVGFSGACFPKDTKALHWFCCLLGVRVEVLSATIEGNLRRRGE